ncbi:hypothetical protein M0813_18226 [Anaeramoeba flamelloides]|uniref:Uncharacterized protein n=1 Tax=Anaeramoeba flamelloides TaxID=1746091 RepID=A0ABQ8YSI5_9EUKA|nr:hypothetical protein M0813_18226 [Anaeramoeba flamelloides]
MQNSTKPFPHNVNPIFLDTKNWVLTDTIQIKKKISHKNKKNVLCVWHGKHCAITNSRKYNLQKHGGRYDLNKKQIGKQSYICKNCYNLWNSWNRFGSPKILTLQEWIDNSKDPIENEDTENSSVSDGSDYIEEEEVEEELHCGNLTHQPSYNEEEYRIYLMTQEANGKELRTTIFGSVKERVKEQEQEKRKEKERKKEEKKNQIEQLKKKFKPNEDQIIRQKSLESGKEQLKPNVSSELQTPHSNYMVNSKQMILLLNNLHCPCGRRKTLEELKENYGSFRAILNCKKCPIKQYKDNKETFNFQIK